MKFRSLQVFFGCSLRSELLRGKKSKYLKSGAGREFIKTLLNSQSQWPRGATE